MAGQRWALFHAVMVRSSDVSPREYLWQQTLLAHPWLRQFGWPVCGFAARSARKKVCRAGCGRIHSFVGVLILHGKIYYLAPAYVMLLAAGSVWIELRLLPRVGLWLRPAIAVPL